MIPVNKENQANAREFFHRTKVNTAGPMKVKRNGKTQLWKTRPQDFKIPVKYGLYEYGYIDQDNAQDWQIDKPTPASTPIHKKKVPIEDATVNQAPALMDVIINIQFMRKVIFNPYNPIKDLKRLEKLTGAQLHQEQNDLIPHYNIAILAQQ